MKKNRLIEDLFDLDWYEAETNQSYSSFHDALEHYISSGEAVGYTPFPLFDTYYYRNFYRIDQNENAFCDFCEEGIKENRNPNYYFLSEWYRWQNPDSEAYTHPIMHYLSVGGKEFRDPSPYIDMVLVKRVESSDLDGVMLLNKIMKGQYESGFGVCDSQKQLVSKQRGFIDNIEFEVHKEQPSAEKRKYLVWVQSKVGSEFFSWYRESTRNWDLLINYYDNNQSRPDIGEYVISQNGTKFTAIFNVWRYTNIFESYEYIIFIDDDLVFKYKAIDEYFKFISKNALDLSQPSLTAGSYCVWPVFFNKKPKGCRCTNGVEIMMPALSQRAISIMAPYFSLSVSGFGLDLLFAKLAEENKLKVAVVDSIKASHNSVIDQNSGEYYELLRKYGINSKYELWSLIERFKLDNKFYQTC